MLEDIKMIKNVLSFLMLIVVTNQQTISFVSQNRTSHTKCRITGDDIILHAKIDISGKMDTFDYSKYELKLPNTEYSTICFLKLQKCNGYSLANCYCSKTDDEGVFNVVINITGSLSYSQALLRGKLTFFDTNIYSEEIKLPSIYECAKANASLYINDKTVDLEHCEETIYESEANFVFFLNHANTSNLPCRLLISDSDNNTLRETDLVTLSYTAKEIYRSQTFTLSYEFCGSEKNKQSFTCNIKTAQPITDVRLFLNTKDVDITNCQETVSSSEVLIVFSVSDSKRSVKRLAIFGDATGEMIANDTSTLIHSASIQGNRTFNLTYELEGLEVKSFYCRIQAAVELPMHQCDLKERITLIITLAFSLCFNLAAFLVCSLFIVRRHCANKKNQDFKKEQCIIIEEDIVLLEGTGACSDECKMNITDCQHEKKMFHNEGSSSIEQEIVHSDSPSYFIKNLKRDLNVDVKIQQNTIV